MVYEPKIKVDGITKYIQNHDFKFDNCYNENEESYDVCKFQIRALLTTIFEKAVVTIFAYGQTGSGKTFTVNANTK